MADSKRRELPDLGDGTNTSNQTSNALKEKIRAEVENIMKKGKGSPADFNDLYKKYKKENMESIIDEVIRKQTKQAQRKKKEARILAHKVFKKFHRGNKPYHEILESMMKYKSDNKWSDAEFDEFRKALSYLLTGQKTMEIDNNQNNPALRSKINRSLGTSNPPTDSGLNIKDSEHQILAEIIKIFEDTKSLHRSVFMQSLLYEDCSIIALSGEYKRDKHVASNYIHPLIACMFLPKFDIFEIHMLYANFGSILDARQKKRPIVNEPDALLYYDITTDPNDVVCDVNSPIADIKNRFQVQIELWETVRKLRNGNYYDVSAISDLITVLNRCRNNIYDNTDLVYNQDEGSMLRRLMSVFSLRPTIIYTKPLYSLASYGSMPQGLGFGLASGFPNVSENNNPFSPYPFNNQPVYTVTNIPMIYVHIPPYHKDASPIDLRVNQTLWINENKTIVPKEQSVIHSKEVLIFYVNRRIQSVQIKTFANPLSFSQLPMTMSSFEKLNKHPVAISDRISIGRPDEIYYLRSVVAVTETQITQGEKFTNIITGCTGLIMSHRNFSNIMFEPKYYLYDPVGASIPVANPDSTGEGYILNKPISYIEPYFLTEEIPGVTTTSFFARAATHGTVFIYAKNTGYNPNEIITL